MKTKPLNIQDIPHNAIRRFWGNLSVDRKNKCWLWKGTMRNKGKYGQLYIGNKRYIGAHVASYIIHTWKSVEEDSCVLHKCDTPGCVNPNHLFIGTKADNVKDCQQKGRLGKRDGVNNGRHKLTEKDVQHIRRSSEKYDDLATRYGVKTVTIAKIRQRKLWCHVI